MVYSFTQRSGVGRQLRGIAGEQIGKAVVDCAKSEDFVATVHSLRRRCKRLRGLLRLVRPQFAGYGEENAAFRDAAALLSGSRDAAVMAETFERLCGGGSPPLAAETRDRIRQRLAAHAAQVAEGTEPAAMLGAFARRMHEAEARLKRWRIDGSGFASLAPGLARGYRDLSGRMRVAMASPGAESFHAWRKAVKYHGHHVSLFRRCAPDLLEGRIDLLDRLGELLGDHHNLAVLLAWTERNAAGLPPSDRQGLAEAVRAEQADLAGRAFALGPQLSAEPVDGLVERFRALWALLPKEA